MQNLDIAFDTWKSNIQKVIKEHPLQIISWEATRRCNLNCKHCGSPSEETESIQELNTEEVVGAFKQIEEDFDMSKFHHINITGGEPFVRKDLLKILGEISKSPHYRNIDIQTNGLYLGKHPEVLPELKQRGVTGIGVSIDGLRESHDLFRGKKGSYDLAVRAAKEASEQGLTVTVSTVVHSENVKEISTLYSLAKDDVRARFFRIMTIDPLGRANLNREYLLGPNQLEEVIGFLKQTHKKNFIDYANPNITMVELGCGGWLGKNVEGRIRPYIFHCIAGINNLGILSDGKLAACSNIPREFGFEGDLRKDRIKDVWENKYQRYRGFEWKKTGDCKGCGEWDYCHGGPMHKMRNNGSRTECLYRIIESNK